MSGQSGDFASREDERHTEVPVGPWGRSVAPRYIPASRSLMRPELSRGVPHPHDQIVATGSDWRASMVGFHGCAD